MLTSTFLFNKYGTLQRTWGWSTHRPPPGVTRKVRRPSVRSTETDPGALLHSPPFNQFSSLKGSGKSFDTPRRIRSSENK
ncbi:hypothetical protein CDAR_211941 [Caerostris darwini]|uniref:Ycf15 n=1 Tax=Caerostris darwini TaxID=1538125 RepID=A0AAV4PGI1_9ARAC|nr:hypothetical protein CDAR_211941 [Caerostris darwini]